MRKIILSVLLFMPLTIYGQIMKGTIITGGLIGGSINDDELKSTYNFQIQPSFGCFILNNLLIGIDPVYEVNMQKGKAVDRENPKDITNSFGIAPKIGYYFNIKPINPYIQFEITSGWSNSIFYGYYNDKLIEYHHKSNYYKMSPIAGVLYRINSNIGLDVQIKYSRVKEYNELQYSEYNSINIDKSDERRNILGIQFGFVIMFPKSEK